MIDPSGMASEPCAGLPGVDPMGWIAEFRSRTRCTTISDTGHDFARRQSEDSLSRETQTVVFYMQGRRNGYIPGVRSVPRDGRS